MTHGYPRACFDASELPTAPRSTTTPATRTGSRLNNETSGERSRQREVGAWQSAPARAHLRARTAPGRGARPHLSVARDRSRCARARSDKAAMLEKQAQKKAAKEAAEANKAAGGGTAPSKGEKKSSKDAGTADLLAAGLAGAKTAKKK